ncbi:hypothetical protein [Flectobacillus roseus]|uniref:hypothetical protein n=1 Tax=Flectobacillus roseus TaxID=502259 RepID=UPI0024B6D854|nr:hypothetical protein [Flectobacillus roseus]MDI9868769.1 hypothetical protein [Flectobacillus roseus]
MALYWKALDCGFGILDFGILQTGNNSEIRNSQETPAFYYWTKQINGILVFRLFHWIF